MKRTITDRLPRPLKRLIRELLAYRARPDQTENLRTSTSFEHIGQAGPVITEVFERLKPIPGWFNVDDCGHFHLILSLQSACGIKGDLFEIGSYHGRSTAAMANCLKPGERIVVCDAFQADTEDPYGDKPTSKTVLGNIRKLRPDLDNQQIVIHACLSDQLSLCPRDRFRFAHVDGGHSYEQIYADLALCTKHLMDNGIIAVDDYHHPDWPQVAAGVDDFLAHHLQIGVLADLNRHGALGRKLYLIKNKPS